MLYLPYLENTISKSRWRNVAVKLPLIGVMSSPAIAEITEIKKRG
jgi:hypothetical protein